MSILPLPCGQSKENGFFFGDRYCYWNGGRVCTLILCPVEDKLDSFKLTHEFLAFFFFFFLAQSFIYLFILLCWVFVSVRGLSLVVASRDHSSSRRAGLSLLRPLVAEHRLQTRRLSSCGSRAQWLRGMWDPPRPGLEPVSPALAGRFSTTAPPGKPPA